ncbi:MAG: hypothetical protein H7Y43_02900 [Akkermansiaceae bacterium]|nr:hypothetical protein [Verrucomicrobiales bacterium]
MARKLRPDEAEIFDGARDDALPASIEEFLKNLRDQQEGSDETTSAPGIWISNSPEKPPGT